MTKKEIVKQISARINLPQQQTKKIVQQTFDAIVDTLLEVGRIELRNFGVFEVKRRRARKARNPRTGDKVDVPPKFVVTFKPGKVMEERIGELTTLPTPPPRPDGTQRRRRRKRARTASQESARTSAAKVPAEKVPAETGAAENGDGAAKPARKRKRRAPQPE